MQKKSPVRASLSRRWMVTLALLLLLFLPAASIAAAEALRANGLGIDVDISRGATEAGATAGGTDPNAPALVIRLRASWAQLEPRPGEYSWTALDASVEAARQAGREVALNIFGGHPDHLGARTGMTPGDTQALEAWTACLRAVAARYAGRVAIYQIGNRPDAGEGAAPEQAARDFAYVFKRSAVAIRSADPSALVALGSIGSGAAAFAAVLYEEEVAAYADALAVAFDGSAEGRAALPQMRGLLLANDPSAKLWLTGAKLLLGLEGFSQLLRAYAMAMESEASLITFDDPPDDSGRPFHLAAMERARALFSPSYAPLVESGRGVRSVTSTGEALAGALASRFFSAEDKRVLMLYDGGASARPGEYGVYILDSLDVASPELKDLASGEQSNAVTVQKDDAAGLTRLALPLASYPLALSYRRFTSPEYAAESEKLDVTTERIPSAEEIIAKHQAVQAAQDALLRSLSAEAEETWHFSVTTGGSFDVTFVESFYLDPNVGAEWEQKELLVNGVRWRTNAIPELPFVLPEKAASIPLDITLSKQYAYTYRGRDNVEGHDCYVIDFEPVGEPPTLSSGKVWIDSKTYARVRVAQVQDKQPAPIVSNDQRDTYGPITGPDGFTYWVLSRIDSQQIYSTNGRTFVINKETRLRDYVVNGPGFAALREAAHASPHTMLRDTAEGLRYLEPVRGGEREVKKGVSHRNLFGAGGVFYNKSLPYPVPLAGINYFDSDLGGRGLQANVFFAGALLFGNLADPSLFGTRLDGSLDLTGIAVSSTDRQVRENARTGFPSEREGEELTEKTQSLTGGIGLPFGKFFKVRAEGELDYVDYGRTDDTCGSIVSPKDTWVRTGKLIGEFNRRAWSASFEHSWSERSRNEPWGLGVSSDSSCPRGASSPAPPDFFEDAKDYVQFGGAVSKEFYLPFHQKLRFRASGWGSRDLDRFSKYKFGFFANRLRGYSGSSIHYTDGYLYHAAYAFNLGDVIRFEAGVDHARVQDRQLREEFRNYTGAGLAAQVAGPWNLLIRLEWGVALASDVSEFEGEQEILLTVLKLFSQR